MGDGQDGKAKTQQNSGYKDKPWIPRFWDGICVRGWFRLLLKNRFVITPSRIAMALIITGLSFFNLFTWIVEKALFGRKIDRTPIDEAPIFVVGHWRSGTTMLHELLVLDPRHTFADTFACFCPNHFLVSAWFLKPLVSILLPAHRPMDNMATGWDYPQEDEWAICNMGLGSPYLTLAFPNHPPQDQEYLDFRGVPAKDRERWKQGLLWFLKCLTFRNAKRIVLKSPAHTSRVRVLLEMFPKAKFVHIVRDPCVLFPSTVNLWKRLYRDQGLQIPKYEGLDEHVFQTLTRMYETFERDRELIPSNQLCEVRYEELTADPIGQMRRVYDRLELGGFEAALPAIEAYFSEKKDYKKNRYEMTPELRAEITRRWASYVRKYGYESKSQ
jgi:omega-hydroxy-beta-dihydromenaquinone-9 sulfotransferase